MSYSFQTLQDFVLNLLNDEGAQSAYAADPMGALSAAGLGDLTPQDVQEVLPLVTDALPNETPLGDFAVDITGVMDSGQGVGGTLAAENGLGEFAAWGVQGDQGGVALWGGSATDLLGRVAGGVSADGEGVAAAATTPLGYVDIDSSLDYTFIPADPNDVVGNLGNTGDAVAGTVAHAVSSGADSLAGAVDTGGDTLAGFLAGTPAAPVAGPLETGSDMLAQGVAGGADTLNEHLSNLPSTDDLPVDVPQVPDLPEVPDLGGSPLDLPALGDLPVDLGDVTGVTGNLPVDLPTGLPTGLPDTGAVTDVLAHNPVADAVGNSPVGSLTDTVSGVTDKLPLGGLTDDLNLGL
ncbi:MAG TPA: IniB N-terminal domain-containing protein [Actinophytocola sp.]|nr:IniB N-terminal domain-containing protein [Actinophytocola sp.]